MSPDISRQTELFLCGQLRALVPNHTFIPFNGGDEFNDSFDIEPPFTVLSIYEPEKVLQTEGAWECKGTCHVISHGDETSSHSHGVMARLIYSVLGDIPRYNSEDFVFHGIDVNQVTNGTDESDQARGTVIRFTCGVSG